MAGGKKPKANLKHLKRVVEEAAAMMEGVASELDAIDQTGGTGVTPSITIRWAKGSCPPPIEGGKGKKK